MSIETHTSERAMLMQALDCLGPDVVLLLDRGYPAAWLVSLLCERGIRFCMRCDKEVTGWSAVKQFLRSGAAQANVTLNAPSAQDVQDWGCSPEAPEVRLVRNVPSNARVRVMATNLGPVDFPCLTEQPNAGHSRRIHPAALEPSVKRRSTQDPHLQFPHAR